MNLKCVLILFVTSSFVAVSKVAIVTNCLKQMEQKKKPRFNLIIEFDVNYQTCFFYPIDVQRTWMSQATADWW